MTLAEGIKNDVERISKTVADLKLGVLEPGFNRPLALALLLSHFYTGVESCLEKKFKLAEINLPDQGGQYHKRIIALAVDSKVIPSTCAAIVVDLLAFRHFARHGYGVEFRLEELKDKAANAEKAWTELKPVLEAPLTTGVVASIKTAFPASADSLQSPH